MKDIPGFEGRYAVTTDGRVWSYPKARQKAGRWLKPGITKNGYLYVNLTIKPYRYKTFPVSRLILETFVGPGEGLEADHYDFDRQNNRLSNLHWNTHLGNVQRSWAENDNLDRRGESNGRSLLTESDVRHVRELHLSGLSYRIIANKLSLKRGHVADICSRRIWRHI